MGGHILHMMNLSLTLGEQTACSDVHYKMFSIKSSGLLRHVDLYTYNYTHVHAVMLLCLFAITLYFVGVTYGRGTFCT